MDTLTPMYLVCTHSHSECEGMTDVAGCVCVCHVLLAGQYLVRTCPRPPAHPPLSEPFPPPPPLLPPSLPLSLAAASPHHQTQTSVWRPRRVSIHGPVPSPSLPSPTRQCGATLVVYSFFISFYIFYGCVLTLYYFSIVCHIHLAVLHPPFVLSVLMCLLC